MKKIYFLFLFILVSCSTIEQKRTPASVDNSCMDLIADFTRNPAAEKRIVNEELMKSPAISAELLKSSSSEETQAMKSSFSLIKKNYPHFEASQVIDHYHLLLTSCAK